MSSFGLGCSLYVFFGQYHTKSATVYLAAWFDLHPIHSMALCAKYIQCVYRKKQAIEWGQKRAFLSIKWENNIQIKSMPQQ